MHETKVSTLGYSFETSPSDLPVRPHQPLSAAVLAGCSLPEGAVLVAETAGVVQRGGLESRYRRAVA